MMWQVSNDEDMTMNLISWWMIDGLVGVSNPDVYNDVGKNI
jgi:hypothetical protein